MEYISRDQFDDIVQDKQSIKVADLVYVLEEKMGYAVTLEKKTQLTEMQRKRMTDLIFSNEDILSQLRKAAQDQDYIENDEEAFEIIRRSRDGK
ncbi:hypothetical protein J2Z83_000608 [Virgibacillus natechei]|uniref:IDEAL domain-containing protein n=1 Tax=Virgibacillus natechei TaxID=1216297 RepID=A0ABS4IDJ4_9BACI|nr:hypothetical protein [Virgibacillus natechei]MBP1968516.1 hypothetical protein [Virgibacillus natechei]UZD13631.1 hypothetical protein OLD84_03480 [Virgibacillus natechei]